MIKKVLLQIGYPYLVFDSEIWKTKPQKRKCFIIKILKHKDEIGMNKKELEDKFGKKFRVYSSGAWSYDAPLRWKNKKKRVLNFYFDENEKVKDIKLKYRIRM